MILRPGRRTSLAAIGRCSPGRRCGAPPALAAACGNGITPLSPKSGATVHAGTPPTFQLRVRAAPGTVWVRVCKSKKQRRRRRDLRRPTSIGRAKRQRQRVHVYKPKFYDFPGFWLEHAGHVLLAGVPDRLRRRCSDCRQEGRDRRVHGRCERPATSAARAGTTATGASVVYPEGLPARRWLEHYATQFDTVEVNTHLLPAGQAGRRSRAGSQQTPPDFVFAVKASRYLTHMKRLTDLEQGDRALLRGDRAAGRVAQARAGAVAAARRTSSATRTGSPTRSRAPAGAGTASSSATSRWFTDDVLRAPARARRRAGLRRPPGAAVAAARADRRLDVRPLPLRPPRPARQLLRDRAARVGRRASRELRRAPRSSPTSTTTGRGSRSRTRRDCGS